jgi:hypothetical protein
MSIDDCPRGCGATGGTISVSGWPIGLPPCVQGYHARTVGATLRRGSIPTHVGLPTFDP